MAKVKKYVLFIKKYFKLTNDKIRILSKEITN